MRSETMGDAGGRRRRVAAEWARRAVDEKGWLTAAEELGPAQQ